ncbi:MAG: NAD(P)-dependent glycerol-3-phosphate dehydrogenase [Lachnospiraceae bacterium]|nr:NAD(P)-dependent glycerol-3-phosphate dehydrogenase [Lachnospiraceae bacterium]
MSTSGSVKIGILGAGTWGVTLARLLYRKGYSVTVWSAIPEEVAYLSETRVHKNLKEMRIPDGIVFTVDMERACTGTDAVVFAVPSVFMRSTAEKAAAYLAEDQTVVSVAKGFEKDTLFTMSGILEDVLGNPSRIAALSGPTHAEEVAIDLPTVIVSASADRKCAAFVQELFSTDVLRVYTNSDILGVELSGALKNIMALAAGISEGLGYGDNTKAALITRGLAEITILGKAMGCHRRTFSGLAGIGDLVVTATSRHSRNNRAGYLMGQGMTAEEATKAVGMVVEGLNALEGAVKLAGKYGVEMPIVSAVDAIVNGGADPRAMVMKLMTREKKSEFDFNT